MGEILLCSHSSPLGEILLYTCSSFSGRKFYCGGKTTLQHRYSKNINFGDVTNNITKVMIDIIRIKVQVNTKLVSAKILNPHEDAGSLRREYVLRIPSVS